MRPEHDSVSISARAATAHIETAAAGEWYRRDIPDATTFGLVRILPSSGTPIELRVSIARLLWAVVHEGKPIVRPAAAVVRIGSEEFDDQLADLLVVNTGVAGTELPLELRAGDQRLLGWALSMPPAARAVGASTSVRSPTRSDEAPRVGSGSGCWSAAGPCTWSTCSPGSWCATCRPMRVWSGDLIEAAVTFDQERDIKGRVARLWPEHRPWDPPLEVPIADGEKAALFAGQPGLARARTSRRWRSPIRGCGRRARLTAGRPPAPWRSVPVRKSRPISTPLIPPTRSHTSRGRWAVTRGPSPERRSPVACGGTIASAAAFALLDTPAGAALRPRFGGSPSFCALMTGCSAPAWLARPRTAVSSTRAWTAVSLRLLEKLEPMNEELDPATIAALWRASPPSPPRSTSRGPSYGGAQGAMRNIPRLADGRSPPSHKGAQVRQFVMTLPARVLEDSPRAGGHPARRSARPSRAGPRRSNGYSSRRSPGRVTSWPAPGTSVGGGCYEIRLPPDIGHALERTSVRGCRQRAFRVGCDTSRESDGRGALTTGTQYAWLSVSALDEALGVRAAARDDTISSSQARSYGTWQQLMLDPLHTSRRIRDEYRRYLDLDVPAAPRETCARQFETQLDPSFRWPKARSSKRRRRTSPARASGADRRGSSGGRISPYLRRCVPARAPALPPPGTGDPQGGRRADGT